ncbi:hypothetical protein [Roseivirga pacifica]|uniref:hypothetical protein n=1 Tax=Roseivirga pacifica TaxID=1267423 RepID=UPI003BAA121B
MMLFRTLFNGLGGLRKRKYYREDRVDFYRNKNALIAKASINDIITRNSYDVFLSKKHINFYGIAFGTSLKACKKKMGKPNFEVKKGSALEGQNTIFYRLRIANVKCVLQLHFFNDQFFFGQLSLKHNTGYFSGELINIVREKYGLPEAKYFELITDEHDNKIEFIEGMAPCIRYTTGDQKLLAEIRTALHSAQTKQRSRRLKQNEMLLELV